MGMAKRQYLGLDLGSVSLDAVVVDESGAVLWSAYRTVRGRSRDAVVSLCRELLDEWLRPGEVGALDGVTATGSGKELIQELLDVPAVNEIIAHGTAASLFAGGAASVIEIGGQDSKFILVDDKGVYDYSMNELCAAGTGAFLDVQAERLGLGIEELSALAAGAPRAPPLAGRCSVFAKSDIVHLQQRGVPVDQIVAGLCYALARNYVATLIRGRELVKPVVFQGGVALNDGVLRAFKDLLKLTDAEALRPPSPHLSGALGAALLSRNSGARLETGAIARLADAPAAATDGGTRPTTRGWRMDTAPDPGLKKLESREYFAPARAGEQVCIGLDIGSVSTKAVALSAAGELLAAVYLLTAGRPLEAAKRSLDGLAGHIREAGIAAVGVTGSGRKLVGHAVGADLAIDEITAQARVPARVGRMPTPSSRSAARTPSSYGSARTAGLSISR
jgi:predicted CoA-substrate-specific enzyme activase